MSDQRVLCLHCAKPLQATIFKPCDDCRDIAAEKRRIALAQKPLLPTPEATSTPVVLCSRCHQPWQSALYKTCENCRAKDAERRSVGRQKQRQLTTSVQRQVTTSVQRLASRLSIYGSCGELIPSTDICTLESDDSRLHVIGQDHLDSCARHGTAMLCGSVPIDNS